MLGWVRRKKESPGRDGGLLYGEPDKGKPGRGEPPGGSGRDTGLLYAGAGEADPAGRPPGPGGMQSTHGTDRGQLEFRDRAVVLNTPDGQITMPYHMIEAWDDAGKKFRVWWTDAGRDYTMSCTPDGAAAAIGAELKETIHRKTFG